MPEEGIYQATKPTNLLFSSSPFFSSSFTFLVLHSATSFPYRSLLYYKRETLLARERLDPILWNLDALFFSHLVICLPRFVHMLLLVYSNLSSLVCFFCAFVSLGLLYCACFYGAWSGSGSGSGSLFLLLLHTTRTPIPREPMRPCLPLLLAKTTYYLLLLSIFLPPSTRM